MKNIIIKHTIFSAFVLSIGILGALSQYAHVMPIHQVESASSAPITDSSNPSQLKNDVVAKTNVEESGNRKSVSSEISKNLRPVHIEIPAARVDAEVISVGVTATNNLDVPPNFVQTGWYKNGPLPGQSGNAVIDGHVDNGGSIAGVFKHLRDVREGDIVTMVLSDGSEVRYEITGTEVVKTTEFPGESVFMGGTDALLKIITCHGTFVKAMDTYDHRLIVTAKLML